MTYAPRRRADARSADAAPTAPPRARHPLAQALLDLLDAVDGIRPACTTGQAYWSFDPTRAADSPVMTSVRFAKKPKATAHQEMSYAHGVATIGGLLAAITPAMASVPALAGAPSQWDIGLNAPSGAHPLRLCHGAKVIAQGPRARVAQAIDGMVDTLVSLPPHGGRVYAVGNQRVPAAGPAEALALFCAFDHQGVVDPAGLEQAYVRLRDGGIAEILHLDSPVLDSARRYSA